MLAVCLFFFITKLITLRLELSMLAQRCKSTWYKQAMIENLLENCYLKTNIYTLLQLNIVSRGDSTNQELNYTTERRICPKDSTDRQICVPLYTPSKRSHLTTKDCPKSRNVSQAACNVVNHIAVLVVQAQISTKN